MNALPSLFICATILSATFRYVSAVIAVLPSEKVDCNNLSEFTYISDFSQETQFWPQTACRRHPVTRIPRPGGEPTRSPRRGSQPRHRPARAVPGRAAVAGDGHH